jgi:hypothetical protein
MFKKMIIFTSFSLLTSDLNDVKREAILVFSMLTIISSHMNTWLILLIIGRSSGK